MSLTLPQKSQYERDGFLLVEDLLTETEIEPLRMRTEEIGSGRLTHIPREWRREEPAIQAELEGGPSGLDRLRKLEFLAWYDDLYLGLAKHPKILAVVQALLGTQDLKLLADEMFMKPPVHGSAKEYHQDAASWPWLLPQVWVTAWLALDDVTLENGALQMVAGSHKLGMVPAECVEKLETDDVLAKEVTVPVKAGGCIFLHSLSLHATAANQTQRRRRAHAMRYIPSAAKCLVDLDKLPGYRADILLIQGEESSAPHAV